MGSIKVAPRGPLVAQNINTSSRLKKLQSILSIANILLSIVLTGTYMTILNSYVQNDYLWTHFNTTGAQTFVSDVFNAQLWNTTKREIALFSSDFASVKDYSISSTKITTLPTNARRIAMEHLQIVVHAVQGLRSQTTFQTTRSMTSYCWLDFDRHWEVAHTAGRQKRCQARYTNDGIVFMEAMLRNTDWISWNQMYGPQFHIGFGTALAESYGGAKWLERTKSALSKTSVDDEVRFWAQYNITKYTIPWHNRHTSGIHNSIVIRNALQEFPMALNHIGYQRRVGLWTTVLASYGVYNDLYYASEMASSLVRNASDSFIFLDYALSPEMWTGGYPDTPWSILLHDKIGPLSSIDLLYVLPPASVIRYVTEARLMLTRILQADSSLMSMYQATNTITFQMVPLEWKHSSIIFYGGNPFCYNGKPQSYVHQSFGYDDACSEPHPRLTVDSPSSDILLAMWIQEFLTSVNESSKKISNICALNLGAVEICAQNLKSMQEFHFRCFGMLNSPIPFATMSSVDIDMAALQVEIVQYAMKDNSPTILRKPIIDLADSNWSFYGWLHVFDWVSGIREVVSFEGDFGTFVLMSKQYSLQSFTVSSLETPTKFSFSIWVLMCYMSIVSGGVILAAMLYGLLHRSDYNGQNLIWFNCVLGVVWLGRPLLVVRGITAITLLSSANINLIKSQGMTYFSVAPRSVWDAIVISGETVWLTYAINDTLTLLTRRYTTTTALLSVSLVWLTSFLVEISFPFLPSAELRRVCVSLNMDAQVSCVSGTVEIGSNSRFMILSFLQIVCVIVSYLSAVAFGPAEQKNVPVIVPAIASHMLDSNNKLGQFYDPMSSIFAGLLPWQHHQKKYFFSIALWIYLEVSGAEDSANIFRTPAMRIQSGVLSVASSGMNSPVVSPTYQKLRAVLAFFFLILSALSSALFFYVSQVKLSNDFLWEGFNTTGMQTFLADWYNSELTFSSEYRLLDAAMYSPPQLYNSTASSVSSSMLYAQKMQYESLTLDKTITGIRLMDPCQLPWIATQYCFVDFDARWQMANSAKRQDRCNSMLDNGAIFVESILRNTDMHTFMGCWGNAVQIALFDDIRQEVQGRQWIENLGNQLTINQEVEYWQSKGIKMYTVQWQNYKILGITETVSVLSALGMSYPLTLKQSTGAYRFLLQTSMKMYWGWGNDLYAVSQNTTSIRNRSLLRNSARFAFMNQTIETSLIENNTLSYPLDDGLTLTRRALGPFGSIDLTHVPCPPELMRLYKTFVDEDMKTLHSNDQAQIVLNGGSQMIAPVPSDWTQRYEITRGGSLLCPRYAAVSILASSHILLWYSQFSSCDSLLTESVVVSRLYSTIALIAWGAFEPCSSHVPCPTVADVCNSTVHPPDQCFESIQGVEEWVKQFMSKDTLYSLYKQAKTVQSQIKAMNIEIVQYMQVNTTSPLELARLNIFHDPHFSLIGWYLVIDWLNGIREVVSYTGDSGQINVISSYSQMFTSTPNSLEVPTNLAYYGQLCIQYTTLVIFLVTFFAILYTFLSSGLIEGRNMLKINRVAAIVWVGRPLLFLRSVVAIMLLATSVTKLELTGIFTQIAAPEDSVYQILSTATAGFETCWLVIVVTDLSMVLTKDYTRRYSFYSGLLATMLTVILSFIRPVTPEFKLSRDCHASQFDFHLSCTAGTIEIGNTNRVLLLTISTTAIIIVCYVYERFRHPNYELPGHKLSLLLPACAHYLYHKGPWIHENILYLDKASAFMCGLVAFTSNQTIYLLDIKTWRAHTISIDDEFSPSHFTSNVYDQKRIAAAVPLVE